MTLLGDNHFKTSHVKVYLCLTEYIRQTKVISKHLMLKFICSDIERIPNNIDFKTSHVKVYPGIFIKVDQGVLFQNISC